MSATIKLVHLKRLFTEDTVKEILARRWENGLPLGEWVIEAVEYTVWLWIDRKTTTPIDNEDVMRIGEFVWAKLYKQYNDVALDINITDARRLYRLIELHQNYHVNNWDPIDLSVVPEVLERRLEKLAKADEAREKAKAKEAAKKQTKPQAAPPKPKKLIPLLPPSKEVNIASLSKALDQIEGALSRPDLTEIVARAKHNGLTAHDAVPVYRAEIEKLADRVEELLPRLKKLVNMVEEIVHERDK